MDYTHGPRIEQPLEIVRMGYLLPSATAAHGLDAWGGPYPLIPYATW